MPRFSAKLCGLLLLFCIFCGTQGSGSLMSPDVFTSAVSGSPTSVTFGLSTTFVESGLGDAAFLFYTQGSGCNFPQSAWISATTVESGSATVTVFPTSTAPVSLCKAESVDATPVLVRTIEVVVASITPDVVVLNTKTTFTVNGAELEVLKQDGAGVYLVNSKGFNCVGPPPSEGITVEFESPSNTEVTFTANFSDTGYYTVCLYTNKVATTAGNIHAVPIPSIAKVQIAPGTPFTSDQVGIDTSVLKNPFLSKNHDCTDAINGSVFSEGYFPTYDENATFYVCGTVILFPEQTFTTDDPTLTILNWKLSPSSVLSRYNQVIGVPESTNIRLNYQFSGTKPFFSRSSTCTSHFGDALVMENSYSFTASAVGVNSLVFLCTFPPSATTAIAAAAYLSLSPPDVNAVTLALMSSEKFVGQLNLFNVSQDTALYSLQEGKDTDFTYSSYYVSDTRGAFLSSDSCNSVLENTVKQSIPEGNLLTIDLGILPDDLSVAQLCVGTPAGIAVAAVFPYTTSKVYPTSYVTGYGTPLYAPAYAKASLTVFPNSTDKCSYVDSPTAKVEIDGNGAGTLDLTSSTDVVSPGTYLMCSGTELAATIEVTDPPQYNIVGNVFLLGVPSVMMLEDQLTSDLVYAGFTNTSDCGDASTGYGSWEAVNSKAIKVIPTKPASKLYLCALVPQNQTMTLLQGSQSTLTFVLQNYSLLNGEVKTCGTTISNCSAPASASGAIGDVLAITSGDCCNNASRDSVLGETSNITGECTLSVSSENLKGYANGARFNLCAWNTKDDSYCVTMESGITARTSSSGLSNTDIIIIVVCVVVGCALLFSLIGYFVWRRWFRKGPGVEKEKEDCQAAMIDNELAVPE